MASEKFREHLIEEHIAVKGRVNDSNTTSDGRCNCASPSTRGHQSITRERNACGIVDIVSRVQSYCYRPSVS